MLNQFRSKLLYIFVLLFISITAYAQENNNSVRFLSLADIHFDPFTACANKTPCPLIERLRAAPASAWPTILSASDQSTQQYKQDSNYPLLVSALTEAKNAAAKEQVKFVIVLGDFLAHKFHEKYQMFSRDKTWSGYRVFVNKTMSMLSNELAKTFPDISVYALVGNNDSYTGDYRLKPNGLFFQDTTPLFAALIKNSANATALRKSFPAAGYYAVTVAPGLRLIAMDTVLFSAKAKSAEVSHAADAQLNWLHNELMSAQNNHEKVMLAMHIPAGVDIYATLKFHWFKMIVFWNDNYTTQFEKELKQFAPEIIGIFAGHLHSDWSQMLTVDNANRILVTGTPSISPIFGNNPGFKIYQYSFGENKLLNFKTYFYPLNAHAVWNVGYNFNQTQQQDCRRLASLFHCAG